MFEEILKNDTIFICGEDEKLRRETLDPLLVLGIKHFYFVNPNDSLKKHLETMVNKNVYTVINSIKKIELGDNNIIACGFKPLSPDLTKKLGRSKHKIIIFFDQELGFFKTAWSKIKQIEIIEKSISNYLLEKSKKKPEFVPKPDYTHDLVGYCL